MSSACTTTSSGNQLAQPMFNYEAAAAAAVTKQQQQPIEMEYDQTAVLRRLKAECDMLTDYHHHQHQKSQPEFMDVYSFSPSLAANQKTPELPCTPQVESKVQNDSGISPGSTGAATANSGDESVKKRNANSESGAEAASPFSDRFSGDGHLDEDDDDDLMDEEDEYMDEASREAGSDVVSDALSRLERALNSQPTENGSNSQTVYQCTMCSYSAASRFHFQAHLNSHFDVKCSHCDFTARTEGKLRAHIRNAHADALGLDEDSGSKVPRVNSQGKLKTHKCKHPQCGFVAVTKLDFWEHSRTHIKAEKLLTCPHCPFVTEYKHHLEYHTRNHLNSKPFKCPKCSYSCVNKSMLNSHMKSHSNVYQFRCRDCAYATKYQHSLKLHLRKYNHTCATQLTDEGEVKVKGRRGPKKTKTEKPDKPTTTTPPVSVQAPVTPPTGGFAPVGSSPALPNPFNFPLYPGHPLLMNVQEPEKNKLPENFKCTLCDFVTVSREQFSQHLIAHAAVDQQQLVNLFGAFQPTELNQQTPLKGAGPILSSSTPQIKDYLTRMLANPTLLFGTPSVVQQMKNAETSRTPTPEPASKPSQTPLDLSREKDELPVNSKHRRKGQAFKLERVTSPATAHSATPSPSMAETIDEDDLDTSLEKPIPRKEMKKPSEWGGAYQCPYCDIAFKDVVMYTMHMGYHGYQDPFTCNMCGQSTHDKLAFFLHIARSSHS